MRLKLNKHKKYLLACSFGPDSMALLFYLRQHNYNFDVAFINYHLREESNFEETQLKDYCHLKGINLFVFDVKEKIDKNVEAKCREIRYKFFKSLYQDNNYDSLLTGHHLDDYIETYYLQKERKSLLFNYGISSPSVIYDMEVIRPLMNYDKNYLLNYDQKNNVPYSIDKTNLLPIYQRNIIRQNVISKLSFKEKKKLKRKIEKENEILRKKLSRINKQKNIDKDYLLSLDEDLFCYALNILVKQIEPSISISRYKCANIKQLLLSKKPNIKFQIKGSIFFYKSFNDIYFKDESNKSSPYLFSILAPSIVENEYFYLDFTRNSKNRNVFSFSYPLTIRPAKKDDYYQIKDYKCHVFDLYKDWKMPLQIREQWPIILNKDNCVIYVPRYKKDFKRLKNINFLVKIK